MAEAIVILDAHDVPQSTGSVPTRRSKWAYWDERVTMDWSVQRARRNSVISPTRNEKGLTATIKITVRDSGVTEVNGSPVWTDHPEAGAAEAITALLVEFYKQVDKRKRNLPTAP
jgi:hypothetical protein